MKKTFFNSLKRMLARLTINLSVAMMVMAPVSDGIAAQKAAREMNEANVKQILVGMGFAKNQTLGQFYKKVRPEMPARLQQLLDAPMATNKNLKTPQMEFTTAKAGDGTTIPVLRMMFGGELFNIEIHNNEKFFAKIGHTEFTNIEINNFTDVFEKLYHNDPRFRRLIDQNNIPQETTTSQFNGFPQINLQMWNALTPMERAQYMMSIRLMYREASKVNYLMEQSKGKNKKQSQLIEDFYKFLVGDDANAEQASTASGRTAKSTRPDPKYANTCVVAGYISTYENNVTIVDDKGTRKTRACTITAAMQGFDPEKKTINAKQSEVWNIYKEAHSFCQASSGSNSVACNPIIYGYRSAGGNPTCIDRMSKDFQRATHLNGPCENESPLTSKQIEKPLDFKSNVPYDITEDGDVGRKWRETQIKGDPENKKFSQEYLESFLNRNDQFAQFLKKDKLTQAEFDLIKSEVKDISDRFTTEIIQAQKSCASEINKKIAAKVKVLDDQKKACDQLHRRAIQTDEFLKELQKKVDTRTGGGGREGGGPKCDNQFKLPDGKPCVCSKEGIATDGSPCACVDKKYPDGQACNPATADKRCNAFGLKLKERTSEGDENISCSCQDGNGLFSLKDLEANKIDKAIIASTCNPQRTPPAVAPPKRDDKKDADNPKCDPKTQKPKEVEHDGVKATKCVSISDDDDGESFWDKHKGKIIGYGLLAVALWALLKSAPKKPSLNPAGDTCSNGAVACPGSCTKVNQVKINGVCQCRAPNPLEVLIDPVECTYGANTGSTTTITCPDGVTKTSTLTNCPKKLCSDGVTTVYEGQNCPAQTPSTKPTPTGQDVNK